MSNEYADMEDVHYAYRLLLGRAPEASGLEAYARLLRDQSMMPSELAAYFLGSNEFRNRYNAALHEIELDGYSIIVRGDDNDVGRAIARTRQWEPGVVAALSERLRPGDRFLDVGANIGYYTAWAAHRVGSGGRVIAIEPMDKNLQLIYATIDRNGYSHVRVEPFAASDASGMVCMATHGGSSNGEILVDWTRGERPTYAQARRLDDLLVGEDRIDIVKFDIEGHELHAWRGFSAGLEHNRPIVLTEFHPKCLRQNARVEPEEYAAALLDYGTVTALHFNAKRSICADVRMIMHQWAIEDTALNTAGAAHLDLLVVPRF